MKIQKLILFAAVASALFSQNSNAANPRPGAYSVINCPPSMEVNASDLKAPPAPAGFKVNSIQFTYTKLIFPLADTRDLGCVYQQKNGVYGNIAIFPIGYTKCIKNNATSIQCQ